MSNGFLSQDEINALIRGELNEEASNNKESELTDIEKDLLGEVGNISMGSASTALYQLVNQKVNITTPVVRISTIRNIKKKFDVPNIVLDVEYTSGIVGRNVLLMKTTDAAIIANLMMGGDGVVENPVLSEMETSAVQEAMNQMIGSAATSMATMFSREINISPPKSTIWDNKDMNISNAINEDEEIVGISFNLNIGNILDSSIMQILPIKTAKKIVSIMMGEEDRVDYNFEIPKEEHKVESNNKNINHKDVVTESERKNNEVRRDEPKVEIQKANFDNLYQNNNTEAHGNIDLILDVPLQISVVLGRTKKSIRDILALGNGSLIELDKLADEPVEVLVNGKTIANGEVVVVDENFGVRITSIVSNTERVKSLK